VASLAEAGELDLTFSEETRSVLLHGHCHQKALVGTKPSHDVLKMPANTTVTEVDSGCCGMAGSFGYEAEHLDWSLAMGERRLMPAIRATDDATTVVAAGTSCRHQIAHATGRTALHPAEFLRQAIKP
jgi:Fe-S oxidoreductase